MAPETGENVLVAIICEHTACAVLTIMQVYFLFVIIDDGLRRRVELSLHC